MHHLWFFYIFTLYKRTQIHRRTSFKVIWVKLFDSTGGPWIPGSDNIFSGTLLIANYPTAIIISMNVELNGRQQIATWKEKQFDSSYQLFYLYFISWFWLEKRFGGHPMFERDCLFISFQVHPGLTHLTRIWPTSVQIWPDKMCMPSKWKKCYRLIQYLPIESASNFIRDNSVSDLHLILAMVELNGCRQKVKTISSKKVIIYTWYVLREFDLNKHRFVEVSFIIRVGRTNRSAQLR